MCGKEPLGAAMRRQLDRHALLNLPPFQLNSVAGRDVLATARESWRPLARLYMYLWVKVRSRPDLSESYRILQSYWVRAAIYDGMIVALASWAIVLALVARFGPDSAYRRTTEVAESRASLRGAKTTLEELSDQLTLDAREALAIAAAQPVPENEPALHSALALMESALAVRNLVPDSDLTGADDKVAAPVPSPLWFVPLLFLGTVFCALEARRCDRTQLEELVATYAHLREIKAPTTAPDGATRE